MNVLHAITVGMLRVGHVLETVDAQRVQGLDYNNVMDLLVGPTGSVVTVGLRGPEIDLASLAAASAISFLGIPQWPETHWMPIDDWHLPRRALTGALSGS